MKNGETYKVNITFKLYLNNNFQCLKTKTYIFTIFKQ